MFLWIFPIPIFRGSQGFSGFVLCSCMAGLLLFCLHFFFARENKGLFRNAGPKNLPNMACHVRLCLSHLIVPSAGVLVSLLPVPRRGCRAAAVLAVGHHGHDDQGQGAEQGEGRGHRGNNGSSTGNRYCLATYLLVEVRLHLWCLLAAEAKGRTKMTW